MYSSNFFMFNIYSLYLYTLKKCVDVSTENINFSLEFVFLMFEKLLEDLIPPPLEPDQLCAWGLYKRTRIKVLLCGIQYCPQRKSFSTKRFFSAH